MLITRPGSDGLNIFVEMVISCAERGGCFTTARFQQTTWYPLIRPRYGRAPVHPIFPMHLSAGW